MKTNIREYRMGNQGQSREIGHIGLARRGKIKQKHNTKKSGLDYI
jgi:hypothetical protein